MTKIRISFSVEHYFDQLIAFKEEIDISYMEEVEVVIFPMYLKSDGCLLAKIPSEKFDNYSDAVVNCSSRRNQMEILPTGTFDRISQKMEENKRAEALEELDKARQLLVEMLGI